MYKSVSGQFPTFPLSRPSLLSKSHPGTQLYRVGYWHVDYNFDSIEWDFGHKRWDFGKTKGWDSPPEMLNLLSPDILRICKDMTIQIIPPGYPIVGYLASGYFPEFTVADFFLIRYPGIRISSKDYLREIHLCVKS